MNVLIVKALIAHMIGDFILQPLSWVEDKETHKHKSKYLYLHGLIHGALILLLCGIDFMGMAITLTILHIIIDLIKLINQEKTTKSNWYIADQLAHVLTILVVSNYFLVDADKMNLSSLFPAVEWKHIAAILFLSLPIAFTIKQLIQPWTNKLQQAKEDTLDDAGLVIGIIERLLIMIFVCTNHFEAVGFLLTAKSVFRFGDLTQAKDRMLTEYILVGTLLSFTVAILTSLLIL